MLSFGSLAFLNPWLLAGLAALPILWWLLRAIPPAPKRQAFAAVRLLLGLQDDERQADKTPWWLLLLRALAVAAVLIGFARPILNPTERLSEGADGPLLLLLDQGWASAPEWPERRAAALAALDEVAEDGRQVLFWPLASGEVPPLSSPEAVRPALDAAEPVPWAPDRGAVLAALEEGRLPEPAETLWIHDGLAHSEAAEALLERLSQAPLRLIQARAPAAAVTPPRLEEGSLAVDVLRAGGAAATLTVAAIAEDTNGAERRIAVARAEFGVDARRATAVFDLPPERLGDVTRVTLTERTSAGGAALASGAITRVAAGIVDLDADGTVISLTSARHYLSQALNPYADVRSGTLSEMLDAEPAALVLSDYGAFADGDRARLEEWVAAGGLLIRFAGTRLAAAINERDAAMTEDPLLPVRLRRGGRVLGGALAWSSPRSLGPFDEDGVFRRLAVPEEVDVRTQVLAEPAPDLSERVWAALDDGTPLVTGAALGEGHVVLFHVTADAEWSSLPISGLFVEMLGRLMTLAPGQSPDTPSPEDLAGTLWRAALAMGADGLARPASALSDPVPGKRLAEPVVGPDLPPGLYARADGAERRPGEASELVINLTGEDAALAPFPPPPAGATVETLGGAETTRLGPWFLAAAIALALADVFATLWLSGRLALPRLGGATATLVALALTATLIQGRAEAQTPPPLSDRALSTAVEATAETTLGYVITGIDRVDRVSARALEGLRLAVTRRTAVEPGPSVGVDPERDEMALYPILYWPLTADALPSDAALMRLAGYLSEGGLLLIDTQNGASGFGGASAVQMRRIARALNLPPLAPVDDDHVLTRSFYLLDRFPGRWRGGRVWAEAAPEGGEQAERDAAIPGFDRVDDNVSPVVVGSADWAAAWAIDERGRPLFPIGRSGDRQRELAYRFGVNLVLYALTGNYKSDQVHAPEVLRRLGQ
ncbi:MAG: DUF4159 domain-containing protein [Pseudomonadota bacterium]